MTLNEWSRAEVPKTRSWTDQRLAVAFCSRVSVLKQVELLLKLLLTAMSELKQLTLRVPRADDIGSLL